LDYEHKVQPAETLLKTVCNSWPSGTAINDSGNLTATHNRTSHTVADLNNLRMFCFRDSPAVWKCKDKTFATSLGRRFHCPDDGTGRKKSRDALTAFRPAPWSEHWKPLPRIFSDFGWKRGLRSDNIFMLFNVLWPAFEVSPHFGLHEFFYRV